MKVKGICKDCRHRWQWGAKGEPQHLWCTHDSRIVKNTNMQSCKYYKKASEEEMKALRNRIKKGAI